MTTKKITLKWGTIVSSGMGHYGTSEAIIQAMSMGWEPSDRAELFALALTDQANGHLGVTLQDANDARARAGLCFLDEDALAEQEWGGLFETMVGAVDDAESWFNENAVLPCECAYMGWEDGEWGVWSSADSDGSDEACDPSEGGCLAQTHKPTPVEPMVESRITGHPLGCTTRGGCVCGSS
jgi:hypothetical protein